MTIYRESMTIQNCAALTKTRSCAALMRTWNCGHWTRMRNSEGFAEDEELRGFDEDQDMQGIDGYVRQDGMSGLEGTSRSSLRRPVGMCARPAARGVETAMVSRTTRFPIPRLKSTVGRSNVARELGTRPRQQEVTTMRSGFGQAQEQALMRPAPDIMPPPAAAPATKEIPYDYVAKFTLQGRRGNRVQDVINISIEGAFVAVAIGYSFIPARCRLRVKRLCPLTRMQQIN